MQDNKLIKSLVIDAQLGNNSAFEQLYKITIEQIYALTYRLTGQSFHAETITKKTYVNAWQNISKKNEFTPIASWLKKIAVEMILKDEKDLKPAKESAEDSHFYSNTLEKHIRNLDFRNRLIYVLHDMEKFSLEEISKLIGISEDETKTILVSTREHLINLIKE